MAEYSKKLSDAMMAAPFLEIEKLKDALMDAYNNKRHVFVCGNGGSSANAMHIANDFIYPVTKMFGKGLRIQSLSDNVAALTCLANDEGYDNIYSYPLSVFADKDDVLIVLSGSGNSPNILKVLETAKEYGVKSFGILGKSGGKAESLCTVPIVFRGFDMQISEDMQVIVLHMIMREMFKEIRGFECGC